MEISTKFAYLPNGIIRNIIAYTGATYKKRNGKYMGQIPKNDLRYVLLLTIPLKIIWTEIRQERPTYQYFQSCINLTRIHDDHDQGFRPSIYLNVWGFKYTNHPIISNRETISYDVNICDWKGNKRNESFEYYRYDEKYDKYVAKMAYLRSLIKKIYILAFMVLIDVFIQELVVRENNNL